MPFANTIRRFSRSNSQRNSQQSDRGDRDGIQAHSGISNTSPSSYTLPQGNSSIGLNGVSVPPGTSASAVPASGPQHGGMYSADDHHTGRPISQDTNSSFEHMNRPMSHLGPGSQVPSSSMNGLSRTDQVVLRYFWEDKYADNAKRDLHFLKFPHFPQYPTHKDLLPYCEIYHLVKTSPGASIISLGSANGVYIGFELSQGAQLHIDMDDEWRDISHHRVLFKPYESVLTDPQSQNTFKSWPKPLTIEFLEEQYLRWLQDLTSFCWIDESVRELGSGASQRQDMPANASGGNGNYAGNSAMSHDVDSKAGIMH